MIHKEQLINDIETAFARVTLGKGIGLSEANAIDDYASEEEIQRCKAQDERLNWHKIPVDDLNQYNVALAFFDAEGMRFHLPAFLIADLKGEYRFDLEFSFLHLTDYTLSQFSLLNEEQKRVVYHYLLWKDENDLIFNKEELTKSLNFWNDTPIKIPID